MRLVTVKREAAPPITLEKVTPLSPWVLEAGRRKGGTENRDEHYGG